MDDPWLDKPWETMLIPTALRQTAAWVKGVAGEGRILIQLSLGSQTPEVRICHIQKLSTNMALFWWFLLLVWSLGNQEQRNIAISLCFLIQGTGWSLSRDCRKRPGGYWIFYRVSLSVCVVRSQWNNTVHHFKRRLSDHQLYIGELQQGKPPLLGLM